MLHTTTQDCGTETKYRTSNLSLSFGDESPTKVLHLTGRQVDLEANNCASRRKVDENIIANGDPKERNTLENFKAEHAKQLQFSIKSDEVSRAQIGKTQGGEKNATKGFFL